MNIYHRPKLEETTPRQRRALKYEAWIKARLTRIERDWQHVARYLQIVHDERLYEEWDLDFGEWAEQIGLSRSKAYDLVAIQKSLHRDKLLTLPVSHARLVLPHVGHLDEEGARELVEEVREMTWHDARQHLRGDDPPPTYIPVCCPRCGATLRASRAVILE